MRGFSEEAVLPTKYGQFKVRAYRQDDGLDHLAVYVGDIRDGKVPVRIHSECMTGDVFHSLKCDCNEQLEKSMAYIQERKKGVVIYLRQEGRGIGLFNKINAYALQDNGRDTIEANNELGFPEDMRDYKVAADMLKCLGVKEVQLITNNKDKIKGLKESGIPVVERVALKTEPNPYNSLYLQTKKEKMDHML